MSQNQSHTLARNSTLNTSESNQDDSQEQEIKNDHDNVLSLNLAETVKDELKFNFQSVSEEAQYVMECADEYLKNQQYLVTNPSNDLRNLEEKTKDEEKMLAMMRELSLNQDGTFKPLSYYHGMMYRDHKTKLVASLTKAIQKASPALVANTSLLLGAVKDPPALLAPCSAPLTVGALKASPV